VICCVSTLNLLDLSWLSESKTATRVFLPISFGEDRYVQGTTLQDGLKKRFENDFLRIVNRAQIETANYEASPHDSKPLMKGRTTSVQITIWEGIRGSHPPLTNFPRPGRRTFLFSFRKGFALVPSWVTWVSRHDFDFRFR
jgi:hypothetical protein